MSESERDTTAEPRSPATSQTSAWLQGVRQATGAAQQKLARLASQAAETVKGLQGADVSDAVRSSLAARGVDADSFEWVVPVNRLFLRDGKSLSGGSIAKDRNGTFHLFRYTTSDGFQAASVTPEQVEFTGQFDRQREGYCTLAVTVPPATGLQRAEFDLKELPNTESHFLWLAEWKRRLAEKFQKAESDVVLLAIESLAPATGSFDIDHRLNGTLAFGLLSEKQITLFPDLGISEFASASEVFLGSGVVELLNHSHGIPVLSRFFCRDNDRGEFPGHVSALLQAMFSNATRADAPLANRISDRGVFRCTTQSGSTHDRAVMHLQRGCLAWENEEEPMLFTHSSTIAETCLLANEQGDCISFSAPQSAKEVIASRLVAMGQGLVQTAASPEPWAVFLSSGPRRAPVFLAFSGKDLVVNGDEHISLGTAELDVRHATEPGLRLLCVSDASRQLSLCAEETLAYSVLKEATRRKSSIFVGRSDIADLYSRYNNIRTTNFLLTLFGDIVLLNQQLDEGMSMDSLVGKLESAGAKEFAEDNELRDATVQKILLLVSALTPLKQNFELLATLGPYHILKQDTDWVTSFAGQRAAQQIAASERKRQVPAIRRHIRTVQGDIFRAMAPIEAAARPLHSIFARDEVRTHWSTLGKQGTSLVSVVVTAGMAVTGVAPLVMLLGAGTHGAGYLFAYFSKNPEAAAQVQRAAETILPWWQVFMKTLSVAVFESRDFVNELNTAAMKRDKQLIDNASPEVRDTVVGKLKKGLSSRIVAAETAHCNSIGELGGPRVWDLLRDLDTSGGQQMHQGLRLFSSRLPYTRTVSHEGGSSR